MRRAAFKYPGEDKSQRVDITIRKNRVTKIGPAVAHQVGAFVQVGGMSQPKSVAQFVLRYPVNILWIIRGKSKTGWGIRFYKNIVAFVVATDRVPVKGYSAGRWHVMKDNVYAAPSVLGAGHVREGDLPIEAVIQHIAPCINGIIDGSKLGGCCARVGLNRNRQIRMIPPVAGVIIA